MRAPVLLDCDPGHDDAVAILLAAGRRDAIDLRAVTTVAGNADLGKVTLNARRVLTLAGVDDVPVAAGAAGPRNGELVTAPDIHGESGLDGAELPAPAIALDERGALELMAAHGPATVVATGPLTNVAALLEQAPETVTEIVFASGVPLTMVGLNLTHQAQATPAVLGRLRAIGNPAAEATVGWLTFFGETYQSVFGFEGPPVHDPCALALVIDPTLVRCIDAFVAIETEGRWTRGATIVDLHGKLGPAPNARVAMELDVPRFWDLVLDAIAAL